MSENEKLDKLIEVVKQEYTPEKIKLLQEKLDALISRLRFAAVICPIITFISGIIMGLAVPKLILKFLAIL